jgi:hypothetical protein
VTTPLLTLILPSVFYILSVADFSHRSTIWTCKGAGALTIALVGWIAMPLTISAWTTYSLPTYSLPDGMPAGTPGKHEMAESVGYSIVVGATAWVLMVVYLAGRLSEPTSEFNSRRATQEPPSALTLTMSHGHRAEV